MRTCWQAVAWVVLATGTACAQEPDSGKAAAKPEVTAAGGDEATTVPSDFARFVAKGDGGHLDTAVVTYRKGEVELVLYAAVHIADKACYDELNDRFTTRDALLYELVGPENYRPSRDREERGFSPISLLQQGLKNSLELTFQLDEIDYAPANFVHADMTPEEFSESMDKNGESIVSIMFDMMMNGMKAQAAADGAPAPAPPDLVKAFRSGEGRHTLRMTFAQQMEQMEAMASGGDGSTLLEGRNEKCLEVLQRELAAGNRRIGVYYGAAHMTHMEKRLVEDLGFTKTGQEWLVAWDCAKRPDPKFDRALVKQRQQAKRELAELAKAARAARLASGGGDVPTVRAVVERAADASAPPAVTDPWGHDYVVRKRKTGVRWEVCSAGQDGELDTADDLVVPESRGGGLFGR